MTSPRLALELSLVVALAACAIENPGFLLDSNGTADATATSTDSPTSTSTSTSTSDCVGVERTLLAEADGFYIAGGTLLGTTCDYPDEIGDKLSPCKDLNFGLTEQMRIVRAADEFEAMYVVRFSRQVFVELAQQGVTSATAELGLNVYAARPAVDMRIGMIEDRWLEGRRAGAIAQEGDSSFAAAMIGIQATQWSNPGDGPRGSSSEVGVFPIPDDYQDHSYIESDRFPLDQWLATPEQAEGLVLSFYKDDALGLEGPSINTREHMDADAHPYLRLHYCEPQA